MCHVQYIAYLFGRVPPYQRQVGNLYVVVVTLYVRKQLVGHREHHGVHDLSVSKERCEKGVWVFHLSFQVYGILFLTGALRCGA